MPAYDVPSMELSSIFLTCPHCLLDGMHSDFFVEGDLDRALFFLLTRASLAFEPSDFAAIPDRVQLFFGHFTTLVL